MAQFFALDSDHAVQASLNAILLEEHRIGTLDFEWGYQQEDWSVGAGRLNFTLDFARTPESCTCLNVLQEDLNVDVHILS